MGSICHRVPASGRYGVRLSDGQVVSLKPSNLVPLAGDPPDDPEYESPEAKIGQLETTVEESAALTQPPEAGFREHQARAATPRPNAHVTLGRVFSEGLKVLVAKANQFEQRGVG